MESLDEMPCPSCGQSAPFVLRPDTRHYGEVRCPEHGHRWISKPDSAKNPRRKANRKLLPAIAEDRRGWCWFCLRTDEALRALRPALELQIHHVIEVADGGTNDAENLQVLCEECHEEAHRARRRYRRYEIDW